MDSNFRLKRIQWLLKADWIEYKKSFLVNMGVLFIAWIFILFTIGYKENNINSLIGIFGIGGFITLIYFCKHIGRKMHKGRGQFLILPAAAIEKYITLLLEGCIYFVTFTALFLAGLFLRSSIAGSSAVISLPELFSKSFNTNGSEAALFFVSSLLILSYMTFGKHALFIAFAGMFAYVSLFALIIYQFFSGIFERFPSSMGTSYINDTAQFMGDYYLPVMLVSTVVVLYVCFLKLKEKELR